MTTFNRAALFGGAMTVELPTGFADVSDIRQVPDHQEVYLDKDGFTSIIFDINERVTTTNTDADALQFHLGDIVEGSEGLKTWFSDSTTLKQLPNTPTYTLFVTQHTASPGSESVKAPGADFTGILLILIRLEAQKTDLVVTVNVPHTRGNYAPEEIDLEASKTGKLLGAALIYRDKILETLDVKDWGLFVQQ
ncbi:MAG: hypothetical protein M1833_001758 [Piccolia ochrophora]|nr:MAG: hypothetical protein M1833_001758 [Piccolia ochrophora]